MENSNKKIPSFWNRVILTFFASVVLYVTLTFYVAVLPSVTAAVAVNQVKDSILTYSASQAFMHSNAGVWIVWGIYFLALFLIWRDYLKHRLGTKKISDSEDQQ